MKVTIELPNWTKVISVTAIGGKHPRMNVHPAAFAVKDGDTLEIEDEFGGDA